MQASNVLKKVLIMAGGTGGHVFPGLTVADYLKKRNVEVHWLGTEQGLEAKIIPEAHIPLHFIRIHGLRGKGFKTLLGGPAKIGLAILQARKIIKEFNPQVVIGMGGFVSGPGGVASWLLGIPLIIHEQNAIAGMTNKLLARVAKKILQGFPNSFKPQINSLTVGNPVRTEIENIEIPETRFRDRSSPMRLLILGGSLGAQAINELLPKTLALLPKEERPWVLHQTGIKHHQAVLQDYEKAGLLDANSKTHQDNALRILPFIDDMVSAYEWADMVLCRAGALTVAELCAAGLGAIFVPFPHAVDNHQTANASFMVREKAAYCLQQSELTCNSLLDLIKQFNGAPKMRLQMACAAYGLRRIGTVEQIYHLCKEVCS